MQELADRCKLSKGYISMLESGKHPKNGRPIIPSIETYGKLAKGMGMSLDTLLRAIDGDSGVSIGDEPAPSMQEPDQLYPQVTMIGRAAKKMSPEKRDQMLQLLKIAFPEEFAED
jgi:transcriptional regulator with XRE-family HTH domain